jgi:hypothetical protein
MRELQQAIQHGTETPPVRKVVRWLGFGWFSVSTTAHRAVLCADITVDALSARNVARPRRQGAVRIVLLNNCDFLSNGLHRKLCGFGSYFAIVCVRATRMIGNQHTVDWFEEHNTL